jgi:hypothetical protein
MLSSKCTSQFHGVLQHLAILIVHPISDDALPLQLRRHHPRRIYCDKVECLGQLELQSFYLEFVLLEKVEFKGMDIWEVELRSVDVCGRDRCRVVVESRDRPFLVVLGKEERENATAAAQIQHISPIFPLHLIQYFKVILEVPFRGGHPDDAHGIDGPIDALHLHPLLHIFFLSLLSS